jgi:RNA polymerase sigma-70 factor, ECF subfamily
MVKLEKRFGHLLQSLLGRTDEQLMWRVKTEADQEAFAGLMARWQRPLEAFCARMTGDSLMAEDITQTTFARVFSSREKWEATGKFSSYLWRVAVNLCHDEARRISRRKECSLDMLLEENGAEPEEMAQHGSSPDSQVDAKERGEIVRGALLRLEPRYREVLVLKHYQGLKFHEIAGVLGIPEGTVKSRMAEGLSRLNRILKGVELPCNQTTSPNELRTR